MKKVLFILPLFLGGLLVSCGGDNVVEKPEAFKVSFQTDDNCSVKVFRKQDYTEIPTTASYTYSVDSETGGYLKDGEGQVNFLVEVNEGYYVNLADSDITYDTSLTSSPYSHLKGIGQNIYRITKIAGDLVVDIHTAQGDPMAYAVTFTVPEHVSLELYASSEAEFMEEGSVAYSRDGDSGAYLNDGEGQVNFKVVADKNYYCNLGNSAILESTYSNLKACGDNWYRITKITGNLNVTLPVSDVLPEHFLATFVGDEHCSITSYISEEATLENVGLENATTAYVRDGTSGEIVTDTIDGGKVYFSVIVDDGYIETVTVSGTYKSLKSDVNDDDDPFYYVTKCTSDLTITITTSLQTA
ncbi:MAG: hypothetical protein WC201_02110 [Bacilli bacterium]